MDPFTCIIKCKSLEVVLSHSWLYHPVWGESELLGDESLSLHFLNGMGGSIKYKYPKKQQNQLVEPTWLFDIHGIQLSYRMIWWVKLTEGRRLLDQMNGCLLRWVFICWFTSLWGMPRVHVKWTTPACKNCVSIWGLVWLTISWKKHDDLDHLLQQGNWPLYSRIAERGDL